MDYLGKPNEIIGTSKCGRYNQMQIGKMIASKGLNLMILTLNFEERPRTKRSVKPLVL